LQFNPQKDAALSSTLRLQNKPGALYVAGSVGTGWLGSVQGYYQYHAVPGNTGQLRVFRRRVCRLWRSVLVRRSQRAQVGWDRLNPLLNRWIPHPHVLHPYPDKRFDAIHPR